MKRLQLAGRYLRQKCRAKLNVLLQKLLESVLLLHRQKLRGRLIKLKNEIVNEKTETCICNRTRVAEFVTAEVLLRIICWCALEYFK